MRTHLPLTILLSCTAAPALAQENYGQSPYERHVVFDNADGADSTQRANALSKAKEYVAKKKDGDQYLMGAKNAPGGKIDCSGLVRSDHRRREKDSNTGTEGSGVLNIESNLPEIDEKDVVPGNLVSFRNEKKGAYKYHIGIVSGVVRNADGEITDVTFIQSSGGVGPNQKEVSAKVNMRGGKSR